MSKQAVFEEQASSLEEQASSLEEQASICAHRSGQRLLVQREAHLAREGAHRTIKVVAAREVQDMRVPLLGHRRADVHPPRWHAAALGDLLRDHQQGITQGTRSSGLYTACINAPGTRCLRSGAESP